MSDPKDSKNPEECEGVRQARQTDKEIKEIHKLIYTMNTGNEVNAANLKHLAESFKELATANSLTHYKLFSRTETLRIAQGKIETKHSEHVKHGTQEGANKHNRYTLLVSCVAIGISIAAVVALVMQTGVLKGTR